MKPKCDCCQKKFKSKKTLVCDWCHFVICKDCIIDALEYEEYKIFRCFNRSTLHQKCEKFLSSEDIEFVDNFLKKSERKTWAKRRVKKLKKYNKERERLYLIEQIRDLKDECSRLKFANSTLKNNLRKGPCDECRERSELEQDLYVTYYRAFENARAASKYRDCVGDTNVTQEVTDDACEYEQSSSDVEEHANSIENNPRSSLQQSLIKDYTRDLLVSQNRMNTY